MAYTYTNPMWDDAALQLASQPKHLCVWKSTDPAGGANAISEEARLALEERGYNVGVGTVVDVPADSVLLQLTKGLQVN